MRILFVAMSESIHTARWINQITDQGWDIHLFPVIPYPLHAHLKGKVNYHVATSKRWRDIQLFLINLLHRWKIHRGSGHIGRLITKIQRMYNAEGLNAAIRKIQPDIIHSLEFQQAGYLVLDAKKQALNGFPKWVASNWGSDVYLFHRLAAHQARVKQVLENCDYYASECERDVDLAKKLGLRGKVLPVLPAAGGFDLAKLSLQRQPGPTSARRIILLKGHQHWAGRGLVGLRAIELCEDIIREKGYRVVVQLTQPSRPEVGIAAELIAQSTGIPIEIAPFADYSEVMRRFGAARIHIGLSISDGISQSLIESMVMGAFPIQSGTACANEWIEDGRSGLIVPAEDSHVVAAALRHALEDDALVDQAAEINYETARQRLEYKIIKDKTVEIYKSIFAAEIEFK